MSNIKQYILKQVSEKKLCKEEAAALLLDLINLKKNTQQDMAIIGMACKLPGANSPSEFWDNLVKGVDAIGEFPEFRKNDMLLFQDKLKQKIKSVETFQGAFLDRIDLFDAEFFKISPAEARLLNPLQRLFLTVAYHAIENAGYTNAMLDGSKMGVYLGYSNTEYQELFDQEEASAIPGNLAAILASRLAYVFNLTGPTMLVDTTCSSAMVALHLACAGINKGDCDYALVGGGNIILYPVCKDVANQTLGILSREYRSKAFAQSADGCGIGEGVIALVIKPLEKAIKDHDNVYAVIKGSAINSDGRSNGIIAPNAEAQTNVIVSAWNKAGIDPKEISYIEAHGTGTKLGDPIEFEGLSNAFRQFTKEKNFCALGSLKTNIGHLDSIAGLAGVMKTCLSMLHHELPPSLHFDVPNSLINFENSALYVNTKLSPWRKEKPLLAGVSSFGLSGTNSHVVLSEYALPVLPRSFQNQKEYLFVFSAKTRSSLYELILIYNIYLIDNNPNLADLAYTLLARRNPFSYRLAVVASDLVQLRHQLASIKLNVLNEKAEMTIGGPGIYYHDCEAEKIVIPTTATPKSSLGDWAQKFVNGERLIWNNIFSNKDAYCIDLPSHPFEEKRYWVSNPNNRSNTDPMDNEYGYSSLLYESLSKTFIFGESIISEIDFDIPKNYLQDNAKFCSMLILSLFQQLGLIAYMTNSPEKDFEELFAKAKFVPKYKKMFQVMLNHLVSQKIVLLRRGKFFLDKLSACHENIDTFLNHCVKKYSQLEDCFKFPYYCSKYYVDVFTSKLSPLNVLYPGGDLAFQYKFTKVGDKLGDVYGLITIEAIAKYIEVLSNKKNKVKILEAGAGMGSLTNILLPKIKGIANLEYCFSDIGQAFVKNAAALYSVHYDFMKFNVYDITKSPAEQGLIESSYDIILAYNVIHTTKDIVQSLSNLKKLLTKEGCIFITESTKNEMWSNLVWGLLDGWWLFEDYDLRPYEPMLSLDAWEKIVRTTGFGNVFLYPKKEERKQLIEKALIVGQLAVTNKNSQLQAEEKTAREVFLDALSQVKQNDHGQSQVKINSLEEMVELVKNIWIKVLEYEDIGIDEDFYELGGDSLLAIKKLELLKASLNVQVEIADLFSYTTIRKQAEYFYNILYPNKAILAPTDNIMSVLTEVENNQLTTAEVLEKLKEK